MSTVAGDDLARQECAAPKLASLEEAILAGEAAKNVLLILDHLANHKVKEVTARFPFGCAPVVDVSRASEGVCAGETNAQVEADARAETLAELW